MMQRPLRIQNSAFSRQIRSIEVIKFLDWSFELPALTELRYTGQAYLLIFISDVFIRSRSDGSSKIDVISRDSGTAILLSSSSFYKSRKFLEKKLKN